MTRLRACIIFAVFIFLSFARAQETRQLYLSGHGKDDPVPWNFLCTTGAQSGFWTNIAVPSNWELQGFGTLNYKKDGTNAESGLYQHDFSIPADWSGQRIFLVFDGAMTDTSAKLNGQSVGETHQGGFYRFKYEVTPLAKPGDTNSLEVIVAKHSANNSINRAERLADFWVFGGIFRPVYLEAVPQDFIERLAIDARADGTFTMDAFLNGTVGTNFFINDNPNADTLEAQVWTHEGRTLGQPFSAKISGNKVRIETKIPSPLQWTAETPNLYTVQVTFKRGTKILHTIKQRFGFRTFEVRDGDGLYVNGHKIILKGVNRHSFWPDSGRCLSEAVHRLDIELIKGMNANAVRMSHYPPDAQFLDLCDEYGLYVLDELTGWHNHYDDDAGPRLVKEMVTRDANHPSILFWDNGNEGGFNTNLDNLFGQYDLQHRRVLHPWATFSGLCTAHYLAYGAAELAASGKKVFFQAPDKELSATNDPNHYIYLPTEFLHGLFDGGSGAALEDYWRMMMSHTNCAGGFLWAWTDDGLKRPDTGQIDTAGNQAPDGIVGPYREKEGSYYTIKQIWSPLQMVHADVKGSSATFTLKNKFSFLNTADCKFSVEYQWFPSPLAKDSPPVTNSFAARSPVIRPSDTGTIKVSFPKSVSHPDAIALVAQDPTGREIERWVYYFKKPSLIPGKTKVTAQANDFAGLHFANQPNASFLANGPRPANTNVTIQKVSWQLRADGWLRCDFTYTAEGTNDFIGVVFDYPENQVLQKSWIGDGPYRVWKNRLAGPTFGYWKNDYNNTITGWRDWVYPEFKGVFSNIQWLQLDTTQGKITIVPENIPYVQVLTPALPPANLQGQTNAKLPECGLGFLHAIPPIGSKFKRADQAGPQSQKYVAHGTYSGSVSFYFGEPK